MNACNSFKITPLYQLAVLLIILLDLAPKNIHMFSNLHHSLNDDIEHFLAILLCNHAIHERTFAVKVIENPIYSMLRGLRQQRKTLGETLASFTGIQKARRISILQAKYTPWLRRQAQGRVCHGILNYRPPLFQAEVLQRRSLGSS